MLVLFLDWFVIFKVRESKGVMKFWGEMDIESLFFRIVRFFSFRDGLMVGLVYRKVVVVVIVKGLF